MSLVRRNLMTREGYAPYCCKCSGMKRTMFDGRQFSCACGWRSAFDDQFIQEYKAKWSK